MLRQAWQRIQSSLEPDEAVLGWFEPDVQSVDDKLHFAAGLVVLTNRRLLSIEPVASSANGKPVEAAFHSWPIAQVTALRSRDRGSLGILEVEASGERLAYWRCIPSNVPARSISWSSDFWPSGAAKASGQTRTRKTSSN